MRRNSSVRITLEEFFNQNQDDHFTAKEILNSIQSRLPSVNLSTIHRNLKNLADDNLISISDIGKGVPVFESTNHRHHHLICHRCGQVVNLDPAYVDSFLTKISKINNFSLMITNHLVLYGICKECENS